MGHCLFYLLDWGVCMVKTFNLLFFGLQFRKENLNCLPLHKVQLFKSRESYTITIQTERFGQIWCVYQILIISLCSIFLLFNGLWDRSSVNVHICNAFIMKASSKLLMRFLFPSDKTKEFIDHNFRFWNLNFQTFNLFFHEQLIDFQLIKLDEIESYLFFEILGYSIEASPCVSVHFIPHSDFSFSHFFIVEFF